MRYSRRSFLKTAGWVAGSGLPIRGFAVPAQEASARQIANSSAGDSDIRQVVSSSDLIYDRPAPRSEEGLPIGNGRMGSLVWTTPSQLRFQINRVDVYANNSQSNSFNQVHDDYCGGCAFFDIEFEGDPFPESGFRQHLSIYDGVLTIEGEGISVRIVASMEQDVIAITIINRRNSGSPISAVLRMLRYETKYFGRELEPLAAAHAVRIEHRSHTATSRIIAQNDCIALTQEFQEGNYCCKSAVAVCFLGAGAKGEVVNDTDVRLRTETTIATTILVSSAASMSRDQDVAALAFEQLNHVTERGLRAFEEEAQIWWHAFWAEGVVELHSEDGTADFVQQGYQYFLYLMAATSRGKFAPKFNGMLWNTGGDLRMWGAQHWFTNLGCYYHALPTTGRFDLMDSMYDMYSAMLGSCGEAAVQQWGSRGLYIPETVYFDGLEKLPDPIAAEMRELYLLRKPWEQRSVEFARFAETKHPYSSRWNWIAGGRWDDGRYVITERGAGPYGPTSHMFSSTAKIAWLYWQRYEFTMDTGWLRERAHPVMRGAVEFYRNHPNLRKEDDGKYHMHWSNSGEPVFGARDPIEDISSIRAIAAVLLKASQLLNLDSKMRPIWQEFLDNLAPLPTSDAHDALHPPSYHGPRVFVNALKPAIKADRVPTGWLPDINSLPVWWYDLCSVESKDDELRTLANATFDKLLPEGPRPDTKLGALSMMAIAAATLGRADAVRSLIPGQMRPEADPRSVWYKKSGPLANRLTLGEGAQALHAEHLGRASEALHRALLQSNPAAPGEDPIIHVFPAWPKDWDARYTLRARGGFAVIASMRQGRLEEFKLISRAGGVCRIRNPFPGKMIILQRNGKPAEQLGGSIVEFATIRGEEIEVRNA